MVGNAHGVVLYEPCGGLCAGLESVLRNGIRVVRYYYSDTDPAARAVAWHRLRHLSTVYPTLLQPQAWQGVFSSLPQDITKVTAEHLVPLMQTHAEVPWLVITGWPCQDLSPAGLASGFAGRHSALFFDCVRIVGLLQQMPFKFPMGYVCENAPMQAPWGDNQAGMQATLQLVNTALGAPVLLDAVLFGSYAHRLRNWWTNLADARVLECVASCMRPDSRQLVDDILDPGRQAGWAVYDDRHPFALANRKGEPLAALPTLVAYQDSYQFQEGKPGQVYDASMKCHTPLRMEERERALGYCAGATAAPGVSETQRHAITGRCMDQWNLTGLFALCSALQRSDQFTGSDSHRLAPALCELGPDISAGARVLSLHGWKHGQPVGVTGIGLLRPLAPTARPPRSGLGHTAPERRAAPPAPTAPPVPAPPVAPRAAPHSAAATPGTPEHSHSHSGTAAAAAGVGAPQVRLGSSSGVNGTRCCVACHVGGECCKRAARMQNPALSVGVSAGIGTSGVAAAPSQLPEFLRGGRRVGAPTAASNSGTPQRSAIGAPDPATAANVTAAVDAHIAVLALAAAASAADHPPNGTNADIWADAHTLEYLQTNAHAEGASPAERSRVLKRSQHYSYANGTLRRVMADGTTRVVPRPETRLQLVGEVHEQCGHFGVKRTKHLVLTGHWWRGVEADVKSVCSACQVCSRVNASLNATTPELHPLPIQGFMYRWHVDLAGPFERSRRGSVYVMICVEAFSKWVELVPLPNKSAAETAYAFNASVLSRFAAPAEVVTDGGSEWGGEFAALLHKAMIDHRVTSPMRPQSNGLAERAVQTSKRSLRKLCEGRNKVEDWCEQLPWISLGYRCSPQASTSFSPYYLMFGRHPVIPPAVRERMEQPLTLDDPEATAKEVHMRAEVMKRACATAADNLRIAQHRDTMRYALTHSGTYKPQLARFQVGDFVWVRRTNLSSTLQAKVQTEVLRIVKMEPHGTVVLQGQCGQTTKNHISNLAPCHLDVDPEIDFGLAPPPADLPCEVCRKPDNPDSIV